MYRKLRKYLFLLPYLVVILLVMILFWGNSRWKEHMTGEMVRGSAFEDRLALSLFDEERFLPDSSWTDQNPIRFRDDFSPLQFLLPEAEFRPWLRWWWPGAWVDSLQLKQELAEFAQKGFGGVDIQPLAVGLDPDMEFWSQVYDYNSETYYQLLQSLIPHAKSLDLAVDVSISSLSPIGGPHVGISESLQSLAFAEATILGNKVVSVELPLPKVPYFYQWMGLEEMFLGAENDQWISFREDQLQLLEVYAAKTLDEKRSEYLIYLDDYVHLDPDSIENITDFVQGNTLVWNAPPGYWKIIVVYTLPGAQSPWEFPASQKGYVLNPFHTSNILANHNYMLGERTGLPGFYGRGMRGFSQAPFTYLTERLFSPAILPFFKEKFGYNLIPYLPILGIPGKDNYLMSLQEIKRGPEYVLTQRDEKIRADYDLCVSEFLIENYIKAQAEWARERGLVSRSSPFGMDLDIIKATGNSNLPEASLRYTGYGTSFLKMFTSGKELYEKPWLSALCLDKQGASFSFSPGGMRDAVDNLFLQGVNHVVFQGAPYQKLDKAYGAESWQPFSSPFFPLDHHSEHLGKDNPYWEFMKEINAYVSRCQYLLRQGKSNANILIYYPFLGFPLKKGSEYPGLSSVGLENASNEKANWLENTQQLLEALNRMGLDWIWVNDESLQKAVASNNKIQIGDNSYDRLILMDVPSLDIKTARNIQKLAQKGAELLILDRVPQEVRGYFNYEEKMEELDNIIEELPRPIKLESLDDIQNYFSGFPIKEKMGFARPYEELRATHRVANDFELLFLKNTADKDRFYELKISTDHQFNYLLDPWSGGMYLMKEGIEGVHSVFLKSHTSAFVLSAEEPLIDDSLLNELDRLDASLLGELHLNTRIIDRWDFIMSDEAQPENTLEYLDTILFDWSTNEQLQFCSSEALYRSTFVMGDTLNNKQYILDLGKLNGAVELTVNTEYVGKCLVPPFRIDISDYISPGFNTLEVWLIPPLRNRLIGRSIEGDERYSRYLDQENQVEPNGLKGPVLIWEVEKNAKDPE